MVWSLSTKLWSRRFDRGKNIKKLVSGWFRHDSIFQACAPRYVSFSINLKRREPVGTCFTATDAFSKFSEYSPCRTAQWGYHRQGYCQAGFSTAVSKVRHYIFKSHSMVDYIFGISSLGCTSEQLEDGIGKAKSFRKTSGTGRTLPQLQRGPTTRTITIWVIRWHWETLRGQNKGLVVEEDPTWSWECREQPI